MDIKEKIEAVVKKLMADKNLMEKFEKNPVKVMQHPKFEMYQDKAGEFRFRLKARNGKIIGTSEGYTAKAGCLNGIESVMTNAAEAETEG